LIFSRSASVSRGFRPARPAFLSPASPSFSSRRPSVYGLSMHANPPGNLSFMDALFQQDSSLHSS
jgi:hypothetical protein